MRLHTAGKAGLFSGIAVAALFLLSACGRGGAAQTVVVDCPRIAGVPDAPLLLFGEMHGSQESPALIRALACDISAMQEVAVGLEMPSRDQPLLDAFMASDGAGNDVRKLLASDFWQTGRDGRSSAAMLQLIEDLRALKQAGRPVLLFAFDDQPGTELERNIAIANGVRRFRDEHPDTRIIALMGNVHAMQASMWMGEGTLMPSGALLADLHPVSVSLTFPAGTIWACMHGECGVQVVPKSRGDATPGFRDGAALGGYSRSYGLLSLTASPPAAEQKKPAP